LAISHGGWRRGDTIGGSGAGSENTLLRGGDGDSGAYWSRRDLLGIHRNRDTIHRLRAREGLLRNSGDCVSDVPVGVVDVRNIARFVVDDGRVVNVGDSCVVDRRVGDVNAVHIFAADAIRRDVDLARAQREPPNVRADAVSSATSDEDD